MSYRTWEVVKKKQFENPWVTYMRAKVFSKNNCINGISVGKPGSGKSWGVLSMMAQLDPDFELDGNWFFKASDFMRAITEYYKSDDYKKGKIWVLDEAGVDLNNLNYYDEINKGLNLFFQTARHRNYIFFATVPFISFISTGVRKLMTTVFRAEGWENNKTKMIPRILQYNDEMDKFYRRRLIVDTKDGTVPCNAILVRRPPERLIKEYEKRKAEFTGDLFELTANKIEAFEEKQNQKFFGKKLTAREEFIISRLKDGHLVKGITKELGTYNRSIITNIERLKHKGIEIKPISKDGVILKYEVIDHRGEMLKKFYKRKVEE